MTSQAEKHHFIAAEELREKYLGHFDKVKSLTKAIEASSRTKITVELKKNKTIQFVITGGKKGVIRALEDVKYEFEKISSQRAQPIPRADLLFLREDDHRKLLASHPVPGTQKEEGLAQRKGKLCLLTEESLRKYDILIGATELRQFACRKCNHPWWANVPRTKPVSTCRTCHVRYNALDREKEFGIGRFICLPCDHTFYGRCDATEMHICYKCQKLTGPPYISPRFKPLSKSKRFFSTDPHPRIHEIIHASTPHDSTGSTIATFLTEDLGSYIPVVVEREHRMAEKDYSQPFEDEPINEPPDIAFRPRSDDDNNSILSDQFSTYSGSVCEGSELSDFDAEFAENISRKRTTGSDSSDSGEDAEVDKTSTEGSEPDSGIGTGSNVVSGTDSSSSKPSLNVSTCDVKPGEFPGVVFSKHKEEVTITKKGGKIEGEGISLTVPPGAVNDEVTILLQACIGGPFCLPEDLTFISPVYLIQPPCAFHHPLTLSMDTFVKLETQADCEEVVFVTSPTTKVLNEDGEAQWNFRTYGSPRLTVGQSNGEIDLKHFCFSAFAAAFGRRKYSYCISMYKPIAFVPPVSRVIFSVTLHHEVYIEHLTRCIGGNFKNEGFISSSRLIHFSDESVTFKLPDLTDKGYELCPDRSPCEILREEVDYAKKNKKRAMKEITLYPPRIEIQIIQITQSNKVLQFKIMVDGVKENSRFNILIPPSHSSLQAASLSCSSESANSVSASSVSSESISRSNSSENSEENSSSTGRVSRTSAPLLAQSSSGYSSQSSQDGATGTVVDESKLDEAVDFRSLYNCLIPTIASKWRSLAVNLYLTEEIDKIEADGRGCEDKLMKVLLTWERSAGLRNPYTWRTIISALEQPSLCGSKRRAEEIISNCL